MARTLPTGIARLSATTGTSSGNKPEEDVESPSDLSDMVQLDAEIPRGSARGAGGLLQAKPKPRSSIGLEVGKSAGGGLGVVVAVPIGGPIAGRGGINIGGDGSIKGGSIGLGLGAGPLGASIDVGVDQDEEGRGGCYQYVTLSVGIFSHTYGRNVCEPKQPPMPPTPPTTPSTIPIPPAMPETKHTPPGGINIESVKGCTLRIFWEETHFRKDPYASGCHTWWMTNPPPTGGEWGLQSRDCKDEIWDFQGIWAMWDTSTRQNVRRYRDIIIENYFTQQNLDNILNYIYFYNIPSSFSVHNYREEDGADKNRVIIDARTVSEPSMMVHSCKTTKNPNVYTPSIPLITSSVYSSSPPNSPLKKKMENDCCKLSIALQLEILRLLGREIGPNGLIKETKKAGFLGEEIERTETPILDPEKPKKIKIRFNTIYDLLKYTLRQANNLDTALDPQSYKVPTGKLQNPKYNRDSEESLKTNNQPNKDKAGNKRELEINKDEEVKMSGFLQQQAYAFQMLRRLEYLFPIGELDDALMAKSLLIPGATGEIKIHNMIMAYETLIQYLDATLGSPREVLTVKDANPAIEGDQPIEIRTLSISDLLRQNIKFHIDTGGDVDALVNLVLRDFRTNLANRIDLIKNTEMVQALFEDTGMLEKQDYISVHLEGDVYAGQWFPGKGFQANPDLEKKTEEATEKILRETMKPTDIRIKVSRRNKDEKTDMRDLIRGLADFMQRLLSIPNAGDAAKSIDKLIESAKFKVQTDMALMRQNVSKVASASRNRTRKKKK